ncbi:hypothetical protein [Effusibacillus dendaii]|uniref:Prolipoprotein diacylglyceryl transferase n=1 Tax=Effusibacillus dendaii TaxID=2743772 RepID=A0A7I8DDR6_9BACL|nr:hypothetical protein [Effusibacillus dendaii]BCJ88353.1 hypothetical protein skT53_33380 [Effusibacillus dendaii]
MAILNSYVKLGLLTIPAAWLGLIIGLIGALWFIKRQINGAGFDGGKVSDTIFNSIFYGFLAALLLPLFVMPQAVWQRPFQVLLGGFIPYAGWIGAGVGIAYFAFRLRTKQVPLLVLMDALVPAFLFGWSLYSLLVADYGTRTNLFWGVPLSDGIYHPVNLYRAILYTVTVWFLVKKIPLQPFGLRAAFGLVCLGLVGFLISLADYNPTVWLFLTPVQWGYLVCAVVGGLLYSRTAQV